MIRVAVILNNGYTALSGEEFKRICVKCVQNDPRKIDWVVPGGIYFHSDGFDHWFLAGFEAIPINIPAPFPSFGRLQEEWFSFLDRSLAPTQLSIAPDGGYMPVVDLVFELDGVRYVKEAGETPESTFWPDGSAPRKNSTGLKKSPPVAVALPRLTESDWKLFKRVIHDHHRLQESFHEWTRAQLQDEAARTEPLKPFGECIGVSQHILTRACDWPGSRHAAQPPPRVSGRLLSCFASAASNKQQEGSAAGGVRA